MRLTMMAAILKCASGIIKLCSTECTDTPSNIKDQYRMNLINMLVSIHTEDI